MHNLLKRSLFFQPFGPLTTGVFTGLLCGLAFVWLDRGEENEPSVRKTNPVTESVEFTVTGVVVGGELAAVSDEPSRLLRELHTRYANRENDKAAELLDRFPPSVRRSVFEAACREFPDAWKSGEGIFENSILLAPIRSAEEGAEIIRDQVARYGNRRDVFDYIRKFGRLFGVDALEALEGLTSGSCNRSVIEQVYFGWAESEAARAWDYYVAHHGASASPGISADLAVKLALQDITGLEKRGLKLDWQAMRGGITDQAAAKFVNDLIGKTGNVEESLEWLHRNQVSGFGQTLQTAFFDRMIADAAAQGKNPDLGEIGRTLSLGLSRAISEYMDRDLAPDDNARAAFLETTLQLWKDERLEKRKLYELADYAYSHDLTGDSLPASVRENPDFEYTLSSLDWLSRKPDDTALLERIRSADESERALLVGLLDSSVGRYDSAAVFRVAVSNPDLFGADFVRSIVDKMGRSDPEYTLTFLAQNEDGVSSGESAGKIVERHMRDDSWAISRAVLNLPPGSVRQEAALAIAAALESEDPEASAAWAEFGNEMP